MLPALRFAYGLCHALTAACLERVGGGEALGLFVAGECVHSVYRPPHSPAFLDGFGLTEGPDALGRCAARFVRVGEGFEWRRLDEAELRSLVAGANRPRLRVLIGKAMPVARELLALA